MNTLFEQIGGQAAVAAAVDIFYQKVTQDPRVSFFFDDIDLSQQKEKQKAFLTMVFGGPNSYTGKDLRRGHARLVAQGLNDTHVDIVVGHLRETLLGLSVPIPLVERIITIAEGARGDVLNR